MDGKFADGVFLWYLVALRCLTRQFLMRCSGIDAAGSCNASKTTELPEFYAFLVNDVCYLNLRAAEDDWRAASIHDLTVLFFNG